MVVSEKSSSESSWGKLKPRQEEEIESKSSQVDPKDLEYFEKALKGDEPPNTASSVASKSDSDEHGDGDFIQVQDQK